ncbi:hypothetical protein PLCT1_01954 [Planctomycetaceae bacterium]|nr:hypothetical protein PLCT1_01954 [Planctomycetaceae bacterium]
MLLMAPNELLGYLVLGGFIALLLFVPILAWLAYSGLFTRANYVDDQPDTRILSLSANGELPPTALSAQDLDRLDIGSVPDHAAALRLHQISDENPQAAPVREKQRRTRVLSLLHRVTETTEVPVEPIIEPRMPAARSVVATVNESRRRRLEELLRKLATE